MILNDDVISDEYKKDDFWSMENRMENNRFVVVVLLIPSFLVGS